MPNESAVPPLPVIWVLGKTGAGKSSLIQALTGETRATLGNGFRPCTRTAQSFDFPSETPVVRFLDTRGLGEAGYDPAEDLAALRDRSHLLIVVARLDDPVQTPLAEVLRKLPRMPRLLVCTHKDMVATADAPRAEVHLAQTLGMTAAPIVSLALPQMDLTGDPALADLQEHLIDLLPGVGQSLSRQHHMAAEQTAFDAIRPRVMRYAQMAGGSDLLPVVGLVSVPATQGMMLREMGQHYDVTWDRPTGARFGAALGLGFGARLGTGLALRQLGKLIPGYGQTIGAVASGAVSFASTFALGRSAGYFLHRSAAGAEVDPEALRALYQTAFRRGADDLV